MDDVFLCVILSVNIDVNFIQQTTIRLTERTLSIKIILFRRRY